MSLNSVITNLGANVALQSLNQTNAALAAVQKRVTTGYRVNDAKDDGAAFAVAQGLRAESGALGAVNQQLTIAKGITDLAITGATKVSDTLRKGREVLSKLADESLTGDQRTQYNADLAALQGEVKNYIANAELNGVNLINTGATDKNVISNTDGTQFTITAQALDDAVTALAAVADATAAKTAIAGALSTGETTVATALNSLAADSRRLGNQIDFNTSIQTSTDEALGALVDADLAKESAKMTALQTRQQLGVQTLGIANQAPQTLLGLFK